MFTTKNQKSSQLGSLNRTTSGFDFNHLKIQAKLKVNQPNDPYEQEADRIADKVVSTADNVSIGENTSDSIQRKENGSMSQTVSPQFQSQLNATTGGGQTMDKSTQQDMSGKFGIDFSRVRIHSDSKAATLSQSINAKAFTLGNDIYFNHGQYQPTTQAGKRLLAHELVHTVQQENGNTQAKVQKKDGDDKKKKKKKVKAKVVVKADLDKGVSTELKTKEKVSEKVALESKLKTTTESRGIYFGAVTKLPISPFSLDAGFGGTRDLSTQESKPYFNLKLKGEGSPTDFISMSGSAGFKFKEGKEPAFSADGRFVFIPDYKIAPVLTAGIDTGTGAASFGVGPRVKLGKSLELSASFLNTIQFDGKYKPGASLGLVVPLF